MDFWVFVESAAANDRYCWDEDWSGRWVTRVAQTLVEPKLAAPPQHLDGFAVAELPTSGGWSQVSGVSEIEVERKVAGR